MAASETRSDYHGYLQQQRVQSECLVFAALPPSVSVHRCTVFILVKINEFLHGTKLHACRENHKTVTNYAWPEEYVNTSLMMMMITCLL